MAVDYQKYASAPMVNQRQLDLVAAAVRTVDSDIPSRNRSYSRGPAPRDEIIVPRRHVGPPLHMLAVAREKMCWRHGGIGRVRDPDVLAGLLVVSTKKTVYDCTT